jgi:hypothetical protein
MQRPSLESSEPNFVIEDVPIQELPEIKYLKSLEASEYRAALKFPVELIYEVPLAKYPLQPWSRSQKLLKNAKNQEQVVMSRNQLSQWFNYDLTPEAFEAYAKRQLEIRDHLNHINK